MPKEKKQQQSVVLVVSCESYIHTYMKFITRCIVEDDSNQRRGLLLCGGVQEEMEEK